MSRADLERAAELLARLVPQTTPGPWRDSAVDGNRYAALVSDACTRDCDRYAARWAEHPDHPWNHHPHDGYGGCLVAESQTPPDRRLMAVMRNAADYLPALLEAVAHEDVIALGEAARSIAAAVLDTHQTRHPQMTRTDENASPTDDTSPCG